MLQQKNVLVTGALGFLGSKTCALFLEEGAKVWGLDLPALSVSYKSPLIDHDNFNLIRCDIVDDDLSRSIPESLEYVVHLAGLTSVTESFQNPVLFERVNVQGTIQMLLACQERKINRFVFASSSAVYGAESSSDIEEQNATNPLNPYAASKLAAESYVRLLSERFGFEMVILRFFNLFGPHQPLSTGGSLSEFVNAALEERNITVFGEGTRLRSFVHVEDAANALALACLKDEAKGEIINICNEQNISILELAQMVLEISGREGLDICHVEKPLRLAGNVTCTGRLAKKKLGFQNQVNLQDGLRETIISYFTE